MACLCEIALRVISGPATRPLFVEKGGCMHLSTTYSPLYKDSPNTAVCATSRVYVCHACCSCSLACRLARLYLPNTYCATRRAQLAPLPLAKAVRRCPPFSRNTLFNQKQQNRGCGANGTAMCPHCLLRVLQVLDRLMYAVQECLCWTCQHQNSTNGG